MALIKPPPARRSHLFRLLARAKNSHRPRDGSHSGAALRRTPPAHRIGRLDFRSHRTPDGRALDTVVSLLSRGARGRSTFEGMDPGFALSLLPGDVRQRDGPGAPPAGLFLRVDLPGPGAGHQGVRRARAPIPAQPEVHAALSGRNFSLPAGPRNGAPGPQPSRHSAALLPYCLRLAFVNLVLHQATHLALRA